MNQQIKNIYKRLRKSKDARALVANFGYLSLLQIAGYVFPLITIPYLSRIIGVEGFGKIAFASAVIVWIQTFADWGFTYTSTRDVAKNRENIDVVSEIFSRVLWARCFLMIISFFILLVIVMIIPVFRENSDVIFVTFLMIPGHIMCPDWFFQAVERMKYITILNIISKFLFTILVFLFIKEKDDYILQPLFVSLGFVSSGIIAMYFILVRWKVRLTFVSFSLVLKTIKYSADIFVNTLMPNLYNSLSTILLGFWGGEIANGLLDAGRRFYQIMYQFLDIISRVFFPFLSRKEDKHGLFAKMYFIISCLAALFLFVSSSFLIDIFYGDNFKDAVIVLRILAISIPFLVMQSIYGRNYLLIIGYEKEVRNITVVSSVIGFTIAIPLVYFFSYVGCACVLLSTNVILGLLLMIKGIKIKNKRLYERKN